MHIPSHINQKQKFVISDILKQYLMIEVNPFVNDFIHICDIPDEELK